MHYLYFYSIDDRQTDIFLIHFQLRKQKPFLLHISTVQAMANQHSNTGGSKHISIFTSGEFLTMLVIPKQYSGLETSKILDLEESPPKADDVPVNISAGAD